MRAEPISPVTRGAATDDSYVAFVTQDRPLLLATAYLLTGDLDRAEQIVQYALASIFEQWPLTRPRSAAFRAVVRAERRNPHLPWSPSERFELRDDDGHVAANTPLIVADLRLLPPSQRAVIVLERFVELPVTQIAYAVERPIDEVLALSQQARAVLLAGRPSRSPDDALGQELITAVPPGVGEPVMPAADLTRGERLRRRHRIVRSMVAAVVILLVLVGVVQLGPRATPMAEAPQPLATAAPSSAAPSCDTTSATCRGQLLTAWRSDMAEVTESHLDPTGAYFSAFGSGDDTRSGTPSIWSSDGGSLAFQLFRPDHGATEVYVQIATRRSHAVRCGKTTGNSCISQRFMDGNRFILTTTSTVKQGMEVQYSPLGDEVITAIAHNTGPGLQRHVTSSDLLELVQDPRLRLPQR
jgi:DNA-directed RNA polymerase specialized sigma24 family protein